MGIEHEKKNATSHFRVADNQSFFFHMKQTTTESLVNTVMILNFSFLFSFFLANLFIYLFSPVEHKNQRDQFISSGSLTMI